MVLHPANVVLARAVHVVQILLVAVRKKHVKVIFNTGRDGRVVLPALEQLLDLGHLDVVDGDVSSFNLQKNLQENLFKQKLLATFNSGTAASGRF